MTTVKEIICAIAIVGVLLGLNSYFQADQERADAEYKTRLKQLERKADKLLFAGMKP